MTAMQYCRVVSAKTAPQHQISGTQDESLPTPGAFSIVVIELPNYLSDLNLRDGLVSLYCKQCWWSTASPFCGWPQLPKATLKIGPENMVHSDSVPSVGILLKLSQRRELPTYLTADLAK